MMGLLCVCDFLYTWRIKFVSPLQRSLFDVVIYHLYYKSVMLSLRILQLLCECQWKRGFSGYIKLGGDPRARLDLS
jgi:hypothetical protein